MNPQNKGLTDVPQTNGCAHGVYKQILTSTETSDLLFFFIKHLI